MDYDNLFLKWTETIYPMEKYKIVSLQTTNDPFIISFNILYMSINPYWQISRKFPRPFYWKTHPSKNLYWVPIQLKKTGHELDRFTEKLIQTKFHISYMVSVKKIDWMSFPVQRPVWRPGKWKFKKIFWMSFPWFANKG